MQQELLPLLKTFTSEQRSALVRKMFPTEEYSFHGYMRELGFSVTVE